MFTIPIFGSISIVSLELHNMIILCIFTYFLVNAHDLAEGIHDVQGDRQGKIRTYATSFGEKTAAKISFFMFILSGILGIILYIKTILSPAYLIAFLIIWIYYTLGYSYKLIKSDYENLKEIGKLVGRKGFDFFLIVYNFIFLDLFLQLLFYHFF